MDGRGAQEINADDIVPRAFESDILVERQPSAFISLTPPNLICYQKTKTNVTVPCISQPQVWFLSDSTLTSRKISC